MNSQNSCAYQWDCNSGTPSQEHVLPDFLGCPLKLPRGLVCDQCNQKFNQKLHLPLRKYLLPILVHLGIATEKTSQLPTREATLVVDGKKENLVISKTGLVRADPCFQRLPNGDIEFIARTEKELDKKSKEIVRKNPNFVLKRKEEIKHPPPEEEILELSPLPEEILYRNFAQMTINCMLYWFGRDILKTDTLNGLLSQAKGEDSKQNIKMAIKKEIILNEDVYPILIATFIPNLPNHGLVKINLFEYMCAKMPLKDIGECFQNKYFVINTADRAVLGQSN